MEKRLALFFLFAVFSLPVLAQDYSDPRPATKPVEMAQAQNNCPPCPPPVASKPQPTPQATATPKRRTATTPTRAKVQPPPAPPCDTCEFIKLLMARDEKRDEMLRTVLNKQADAALSEAEAKKIAAQAELTNAEANKTRAAVEERSSSDIRTAQINLLGAQASSVDAETELFKAQARWMDRMNKYPKSAEIRAWFGTFLNPGGLVGASMVHRPSQVNATGGNAASSAVGGQGGQGGAGGSASSSAVAVNPPKP